MKFFKFISEDDDSLGGNSYHRIKYKVNEIIQVENANPDKTLQRKY